VQSAQDAREVLDRVDEFFGALLVATRSTPAAACKA
jgi:hypothetical protein